jgi:hypothetical protein
MQATRAVRSFGQHAPTTASGAGQKLLLPAQSFWHTLFDAYQGAWTLVTDDTARGTFEKAIKAGIIKEHVLQNSTYRSMITFSLFHNLQDPLWRKHGWEATEFVAAVGPALENFHDTLGVLRNQLPEHLLQETVQAESTTTDDASNSNETKEEEAVILESITPATGNDNGDANESPEASATEALLGTNYWRKQALEDPESSAGLLAKMTTDGCLEAFYYTSKVDTMARASLNQTVEYVPGSCEINHVALLNARVHEIYPEMEEHLIHQTEHPELAASEVSDDPPVAAQMDVLYEVTHTYQQTVGIPAAFVEPQNDNNADNDDDAASATDTPAKQELETVSYTNLVVAVLEGWLYKNPEKQGLRWKVTMLRDALEFPHHPPSVRRHDASS